MLLGYNTNGFAHHRLADAIAILADIGYQSIAVTLDHTELDPPDSRGVTACVQRLRAAVGQRELALTIETGARFLLDPLRKHQPTLISGSVEQRRRRRLFLEAAIDVAAELGVQAVSLWSGAADGDGPDDLLLGRLADELSGLLDHADRRSVGLAFEPEPGMFIATMAEYERLFARLDHPRFGLTLDLGHVHCLSDGDSAAHIRHWADHLWNIHIEDMRPGRHEHLPFGEGDMDFAPIFNALHAVSYAGPIHVELPRHSHNAVETAQAAYVFLSRMTRGR